MDKKVVVNFAHPLSFPALLKLREWWGEETQVIGIHLQLDFRVALEDQIRSAVDEAITKAGAKENIIALILPSVPIAAGYIARLLPEAGIIYMQPRGGTFLPAGVLNPPGGER